MLRAVSCIAASVLDAAPIAWCCTLACPVLPLSPAPPLAPLPAPCPPSLLCGACIPPASHQPPDQPRALLKGPPILILDEATSALDPLTEVRLQMGLDEVTKGRTTFVIAHRLATVREATRILVFRDGRIIEAGTFDELVQRSDFFAELVRAQFIPMAGSSPPTMAGKEDPLVET